MSAWRRNIQPQVQARPNFVAYSGGDRGGNSGNEDKGGSNGDKMLEELHDIPQNSKKGFYFEFSHNANMYTYHKYQPITGIDRVSKDEVARIFEEINALPEVKLKACGVHRPGWIMILIALAALALILILEVIVTMWYKSSLITIIVIIIAAIGVIGVLGYRYYAYSKAGEFYKSRAAAIEPVVQRIHNSMFVGRDITLRISTYGAYIALEDNLLMAKPQVQNLAVGGIPSGSQVAPLIQGSVSNPPVGFDASQSNTNFNPWTGRQLQEANQPPVFH